MVALKLNPYRVKNGSGVRPLNLRYDVSAVTSLLEMVFHQHIGRAGRKALAPTYSDKPGWLRPDAAVPGFVFEHQGRIVGNVSLLESKTPGRYLVANVAVHPDFRRRGIARRLMEQVITYTYERGGRWIDLQVEEDNSGAVELYKQFAFRPIGTTVMWQISYYNLHDLPTLHPSDSKRPDHYEGFQIRPLRREDARAAYEIDVHTFPLPLQWPEPIQPSAYRHDWWRKWSNLVSGRNGEVWVAADQDNLPIGLGAIESEWGRPHILKLRILPEWQAAVERILLAKLLRRVRQLSRRPVMIDQLQEDELLADLLDEAGFHQRRTLMTMRYQHRNAP